jgi:signal transduction histidine kinase
MIANYSIRRRLLYFITASTLGLTLLISGLALLSAYEEIEEVYDAQLAHSAKILLQLTEKELGESNNVAIELGTERPDIAHHYENKLTFRIWKDDILSTQSTQAVSFGNFNAPPGYSNESIDGVMWRFFVLLDPASNITIEVAEQLEIRQELILKILASFWLPLFLFVPMLILIIWWVIRIALKPIFVLSNEINNREANDFSPIHEDLTPTEIRSLIHSMNSMLQRIQSSFIREKQFTDNAAHELRTPLAAMKAQTQVLIKKSAHVPEFEEGLNDLLLSIDRATQMIEQLLELARLQAGVTDMQPVDLHTVLIDTLQEISPLAERRHIQFKLHSTSSCLINGNAHALTIMLKNVIGNAIKFSPPASTIEITIESDAGQVILAVSDKGPGIPDQDKHKIFERFYRVKKSSHFSGSGLGLSIVKWVSDLHGADIKLRDNQPHGLRFELIFPLVSSAE